MSEQGNSSEWRTSSFSFANGNCLEAAVMYRKSSYSNPQGACIEADSFRKSSHSAAGNCVEAGHGSSAVGVRDTQQAHLGDARTVLEFTPAAWSNFTARLRAA